MPLVIPVAHDIVCPWCWIAVSQTRRLTARYGVEFDWLGYELYPDGLDTPTYSPKRPAMETDKPPTPRRLALAYAAEDMDPPSSLPPVIRSHNPLEAIEYAKTIGAQQEVLDRLYSAFWKHGMDISSLEVLELLFKGITHDFGPVREAIVERRFKDKIVGFDKPAYSKGIYNVPTFWIGGVRYAEEPYRVLARVIEAAIG